MKIYFIMAWRNIWRNRRRTLITAASVFFALLLALVMRAVQVGSYDMMIQTALESYSGYLQIQHPDYKEDRSLDNTFESNPVLIDSLKAMPGVSAVIQRLEGFALSSSGEQTKPAMIVGITPDEEAKLTMLDQKLVKYRVSDDALAKAKAMNLPDDLIEKLNALHDKAYANQTKLYTDLQLSDDQIEMHGNNINTALAFSCRYINDADSGVLVGYGLAQYLNLELGDTIVLISQGYQGNSAAGKYPVVGFIKFPVPQFDRGVIYMPLALAQTYFSAPGMLTSVVLNADDKRSNSIDNIESNIAGMAALDGNKVYAWPKLNKELVQQIESDKSSSYLMIGILYLVVAFGIFGTVLMMIAERKREFGVMMAVGMQKWKIILVVVIEILIIGIMGIVASFLASIPIIQWYRLHPIHYTGDMAKALEGFGIEPILPMAFDIPFMIQQVWVVVILIVLASIYPLLSILRLNAMKALHS